MTLLSLRLSRAVANGRAAPAEPSSRADLLRALLRKRAAAHNVGDEELEALLKDQIRWALPIEREPHTDTAPTEDQDSQARPVAPDTRT